MKKDDIKIARGQSISKERERRIENQPGGSNVGKYSRVDPQNFAGNKCGLPGTYPINTKERAKAALSYAHNAENPTCIKQQVYKKYPDLKTENK